MTSGGGRGGVLRAGQLSLRLVLGVAVVLIVAASSALLSVTVEIRQRSQLEDSATSGLRAVNTIQRERIGAYVDGAVEAARLSLGGTLAAEVAAAVADGPSGERLVGFRGRLREGIRPGEQVRRIVVFGLDGTLVVGDRRIEEVLPADVELAASTQTTVSVGRVRVGGDGLPGLPVAVPLSVEGQSVAVAVVELTVDELWAVAGSTEGLGATGETTIAQRGSDGSAVYVTALRKDPDAALVRSMPLDRRDVPIVRAVAGEEISVFDGIDYAGDEIIAVGGPVAGTPFAAITKIDRVEAFSGVESLRSDLLRATVLAIAAAVLASALLARRLGRSAGSLASAAAAVAAGDETVRAPSSRIDEIDRAASSFNVMTDRLLEARRHLEQRVEERTAELALANEALTEQALHDPLTGLANRVLLTDRIQQALGASARSGHHVALLFLDLDGFKPVNDTYGHAVGDEVLRTVARRLEARLRRVDAVARLGGDEFAVLLGEVDAPESAERLAAEVEAMVSAPMTDVGPAEISVGVSIGRVVVGPREAPHTEPDQMLREADALMYEQKRRRGAAR